jgi:hypothetical protein
MFNSSPSNTIVEYRRSMRHAEVDNVLLNWHLVSVRNAQVIAMGNCQDPSACEYF